MLHILRQSPFENPEWTRFLAVLERRDAVLLIEDATYALLSSGTLADMAHAAVHVLAPDMHARGLHDAKGCRTVDYDGFVDLVAQETQTLCWT